MLNSKIIVKITSITETENYNLKPSMNKFEFLDLYNIMKVI